MSDSRSLVTRHLTEWVTRGDEKLLAVGRQMATADRAREREQRRLQASYRQLAAAASSAGLQESRSSRETSAAAATKTARIGRLTVAEERLQREVLGAARAQLTEERAMRAAARTAAQYATAKQRQAESLHRVTTAANTSTAALQRNARAGAAAARGSALGEARSAGSRGIGIATGVAGAAGAAGVFGVANLARESIDYERQMSQVQAVSGATRREMEQLDQLAMDLGAKTAYSASESAMALGELGKAGFTAAEQLSTLPGTIDLAAASGTDLAEAATIQSDALRGFGLDVGQATHVADIFAVAVNRSAIEMSDLGYTLKYMAPIAATTGQSIEDMSAAVAILGNVGIRGDTAGTTLRRVMTSIVKPTKASVMALDELGLAAEDLQGPDGLKPLPDIIARLVEEAEKLPKADRLRVMTTIFGRESISGVMALLDHGAPKLRKLSAEMYNAEDASGRMARTMQDNVYYQVEQVTGAIDTLALKVFAAFAPSLQSAATDAANAIEQWTATEGNIEGVTSAISDAASTVGDLVEAGMPLVDLAVSLADAWQALPDPVRLSVLQFGALALVARKLAGSAAAGGLIATLDRLRGGLRATSAEAVAAQSTLGGLGASQIPMSTTPGAARAVAAAAAGPSRVTQAARDAALASAAAATRQGSAATRLRIEARDAAAAYERDMRRMAAMPLIVARAEQQAALVRNTSALGGATPDRARAAEGVAAAARQELQTMRESTLASGRHAAERRAAAVAASSEAAATARTTSLLRSQAAHHARMDGLTAPAAGRIAGARETRPLGAIGTWQMTRGLGGTRREALAESTRRTAMRIPTPTVTGRGVAGAAAAGGIGAAISGGSVASAAISGGAIGMVGGPWGAAAGAASAAGITALVNEFRRASTERAEKAAGDFAKRVTKVTSEAVDAGVDRKGAGRLARASAVAREAEEIRKYGTWLKDGGSDDDSIRRALGGRAKAAGLDLDAVMEGRSRAEQTAVRTSAKEVTGQFAADRKKYRFFDERQLAIDAKKQLAVLPAAARDAAARSMAEHARTLERQGRIAKGATGRLVMELGRLPGDLPQKWEHAGRAAVRAIDSQMEDRRVVRSAERLMDEISRVSDSLDLDINVKTLPGAVGKMRIQLDTLRKMATDKSLPKEMREDAARQLPAVKKTYDENLKRMAWRMGLTREEAGRWARDTSRAARKAGGTAEQVKVLRDEVKRLGDEMGYSKDPVKQLEAAFRDLGSTAAQAKKLAEEASKVPPPADGPLINPTQNTLPPVPGKRRGGAIRAYAHGGPIIDTMMSGGEEYLPPDVAARYPAGMLDAIGAAQRPHFRRGGPVAGSYNLGGLIIPGPSDRDGTYVPAEEGGFVLTGDGRRMRDEMMGYARGGFIATAYGPPWGGIEGTGVTKTGVDLKSGPKRYIIAVDPSVIPLHSRLGVWPNPFGYRGKFAAEDTGGAIKGKRIDFYDWRGRESQNKWGRREVSVGTSTVRDDGSKASTPGYSYTKTTDDIKGMSARDAYRQRALLRRPNVDVSGVFDEARQGVYDAAARARMLSEIIGAGRVNIERRKVTVPGIDGERAAGEDGVNAGATPRVAKMATWAKRAVNKWPKYVYGGGHGASNSGPYDCSGLVSSTLSYGGFGKPGTTDQLKTWGEAGAGKQITIGVRGSTGRNAHTMIKLGRRYFEAGGGRSAGTVGERPGWSGSFPIKRHPKGYARGGPVVSEKALRAAPQFVRSRLAIPGALDPNSPDFVGWGLRRGGPVRRFATGGRVGSTSRIIRDTRGTLAAKAPRAALTSLYSAGIREQRQVTDALEDLQRLLGDTRRVSIEQLEALNAELKRGIDRTRAKASPKGADISRGEQAQNRRSQSALALVHEAVLDRAARQAARGDRLGSAIEDQRAMVERSLRRAAIDPDSALGLQRQGRQIGWERAQRGVQLGQLERAREIARKAGASGRETVRGLDEEIRALKGDIAELAVAQLENVRAVVTAANDERTQWGQALTDRANANIAFADASRRVARVDGTPAGMVARARDMQSLAPLLDQQARIARTNADALGAQGRYAEAEAELTKSAQLFADSLNSAADAADLMREASLRAAQIRVDTAAHGSTMTNLGLQRLELEQRLAKTYEGGGTQRAEYIRSTVVPALQAELAALQQRLAESQSQEAGLEDKPLTRADMEAIGAKTNEILQASLSAQEAIEENTNRRQTGGTLGFSYRNDIMTDLIMDGIGA